MSMVKHSSLLSHDPSTASDPSLNTRFIEGLMTAQRWDLLQAILSSEARSVVEALCDFIPLVLLSYNGSVNPLDDEGRLKMATELLQCGADHSAHHDGKLPLVTAIRTKDDALAKLYLEAGANPNLTEKAAPGANKRGDVVAENAVTLTVHMAMRDGPKKDQVKRLKARLEWLSSCSSIPLNREATNQKGKSAQLMVPASFKNDLRRLAPATGAVKTQKRTNTTSKARSNQRIKKVEGNAQASSEATAAQERKKTAAAIALEEIQRVLPAFLTDPTFDPKLRNLLLRYTTPAQSHSATVLNSPPHQPNPINPSSSIEPTNPST